MPRSPTQVFALLAVCFVIGGIALSVQSGSVLPLLVTALALWAVLKFVNGLERRR